MKRVIDGLTGQALDDPAGFLPFLADASCWDSCCFGQWCCASDASCLNVLIFSILFMMVLPFIGGAVTQRHSPCATDRPVVYFMSRGD